MPFKSKKQERYLWAKHPEIAKRWEKKYGSYNKKRSQNIIKIKENKMGKKAKKGGKKGGKKG